MTKCKCGNWDVGQNDFVEDDSSTGAYCSYYCRRYHEEGHKKVLASDSKHHSNHWVYPKIDHECDYCGSTVKITYSQGTKNGAKRFCSRECWRAMCGGRKKAKPRWAILRSLKQRGPMHGDEIAYVLNRWEYPYTVRNVSAMLRPYVSKGICTRDDRGVYRLVDDRPVGYLAAHE